MDHYSTEIASTLARAAADAYRPKVEAQMVGLNWQADDAEFIEEDDSTALLIADGSSLLVAQCGSQISQPMKRTAVGSPVSLGDNTATLISWWEPHRDGQPCCRPRTCCCFPRMKQDQLLELIGKIEQRKSEVIDVKPSGISAGRPDGN